MKEPLIKSKILEKYKSIRYFCFLNDINFYTLRNYCSGKNNINFMKSDTVSKICNILQCYPCDIGYTKDCWYILLPNGGIKIVSNYYDN